MQLQQTNVERRNFAWFALASAEQCRLLCCRLTQQGVQQVEERGSLQNTLPDPEHVQSVDGGGEPNVAQERERRFATRTADWLNQMATTHDMTRLVVFASPRMLGFLRRTTFYVSNGHLTEAGDDLMRLQAGELADHPLVCDVVRARHSR